MRRTREEKDEAENEAMVEVYAEQAEMRRRSEELWMMSEERTQRVREVRRRLEDEGDARRRLELEKEANKWRRSAEEAAERWTAWRNKRIEVWFERLQEKKDWRMSGGEKARRRIEGLVEAEERRSLAKNDSKSQEVEERMTRKRLRRMGGGCDGEEASTGGGRPATPTGGRIGR